MASPRTIRTAVVVDIVLVVALLVAAVAYLTGGGAPSAAPTGSGTAGATTPAPAVTGASSFSLPSGNIACAMTTDGVTCTIASITYSPPPAPQGCTGATGHVVTLDAHAVTFPCVDGPPPSVADTGVRVLEYGSSATVGEFTCKSAKDGVTCSNGSGTGFRLARGSWTNIP
jgi:hypothetical protein